MQRLGVSCAVRYIYVVRRQRVKNTGFTDRHETLREYCASLRQSSSSVVAATKRTNMAVLRSYEMGGNTSATYYRVREFYVVIQKYINNQQNAL